MRRNEHAWRAESALDATLIKEGGLKVAERLAVGKPLDRRDFRANGLQREVGARVDGTTVDHHHAGAALAVVATLLGTGQTDVVANRADECGVTLELDRIGHAIDGKCRCVLHCPEPFMNTGVAGIGNSSPRARWAATATARFAITPAMARR